MAEVTQILARVEGGDPRAAAELLPLVYGELRRLAAARLVQEKPGQTLEATALVHEAYLRLVGNASSEHEKWDNRGHFFAAAATAMRRILVENARRKSRERHGGQFTRAELNDFAQPQDGDELLAQDNLLALDQALTQLELEDAVAARVVELHHFAGLSHEAVAQTLGITIYEARQKWAYSRAWLLTTLEK